VVFYTLWILLGKLLKSNNIRMLTVVSLIRY
jgi:hypothetical protein